MLFSTLQMGQVSSKDDSDHPAPSQDGAGSSEGLERSLGMELQTGQPTLPAAFPPQEKLQLEHPFLRAWGWAELPKTLPGLS